jgi:hypothetical protein
MHLNQIQAPDKLRKLEGVCALGDAPCEGMTQSTLLITIPSPSREVEAADPRVKQAYRTCLEHQNSPNAGFIWQPVAWHPA